MAGKAPIPYYRYDIDGKFLEKFECGRDVFRKYYDAHVSGRLVEENSVIRELPDGTLLTKERIGRDALVKAYKIMKSPYCQMKKSKYKEKSFSIYNLKEELLGTFPNIVSCEALTGLSYGRIFSGLKQKRVKSQLIFKYN